MAIAHVCTLRPRPKATPRRGEHAVHVARVPQTMAHRAAVDPAGGTDQGQDKKGTMHQ